MNPQKKGYILFVDNYEYCPVSVKLDFKLTNLKIENKKDIIIIEPNKPRQQLAVINVYDKSKAYSFNYTYESFLGKYTDNHFFLKIGYYQLRPFFKPMLWAIHFAYNFFYNFHLIYKIITD